MTSLRRVVPLLAVGALLMAAAISAMLATPQVTPPKRGTTAQDTLVPTAPPTGRTVAAVPPDASRTNDIRPPDWLLGAVKVVCLALLLAIVVVLVVWLVRRRNTPRAKERPLSETTTTAEASRSEVIAAVDAGLSDLDDADADPRRAVIGCWVRLEQAAAAAGTPRSPGDTPTDLVGRLLAAHEVSAALLYPLAEAYRLARYASHAIDADMRDRARAALGQLRAQLAGTAEPARPAESLRLAEPPRPALRQEVR